MKIGSIQKTSLIEFPGFLSCIIFTQGCNFRCPYCHNPELVLPEKFGDTISENEVFSFLEKRRKYLEGVVITGGEPTIQMDIFDFIKKIKSLNFKVKLDTNGSKPEIIEELLNKNLIDYISMDIKGPFEKYENIVGVKVNISEIQKSIDIIINSNIDYEFKTTIIKSQLGFDDFDKIGKIIEGAKKYFLQKFRPSKLVDEKFLKEETYTDEDFEIIKKKMQNYVKYCEIR